MTLLNEVRDEIATAIEKSRSDDVRIIDFIVPGTKENEIVVAASLSSSDEKTFFLVTIQPATITVAGSDQPG